MIGILTKSPIWSGVGGFVGRLIIMFPMAYMCLIWLNMHLFSWRLVLIMSLYLWDVMICTLLDFPVSCWCEMDSKTCWTAVVYIMPIMRIQTFVLFLSGKALLHGLLFFYWDMYDMLWCSKYCVTMPMIVPLDGKLTLTSNISYLMKGWS